MPRGKPYLFTDMTVTLVTDVSNTGAPVTKMVMLPVYLLDDPLLLEDYVNPPFTLYLNTEYRAACTEVEFLAFYEDCGWYDVQYEPGCITVTDWADGAPCDAEAVVHKYHPHEELLPFCIRMEQREDGLYFSFVNVPQ